METKRQELRNLLDALPDDALQRAEQALRYCTNPREMQFTIEQARKRVWAMSMKSLKEHARETGKGFIMAGTSSGMVKPDGDFQGSMGAWDDGPVTYRLLILSGHRLEIYERFVLATDGSALMLTQRIVGPTGAEQVLTANIPVPIQPTG